MKPILKQTKPQKALDGSVYFCINSDKYFKYKGREFQELSEDELTLLGLKHSQTAKVSSI